jgi:protein-tyrosine-phosphatase
MKRRSLLYVSSIEGSGVMLFLRLGLGRFIRGENMSIHHAASSCLLVAGLCAALACAPVFAADSPGSTTKPADSTVVFVCKYGSVKSLVAATRFNQLAEQRGLSVRAIGRAANPGTLHTEVPKVVIQGLARDGIDVANYKPQVLAPEEAAAAMRVVHISLQGEPDPDSSVAAAASPVKEERWDDVLSMLRPSDANGSPTGDVDLSGQTYHKAETVMISHIQAMLDELAKKPASTAAR